MTLKPAGTAPTPPLFFWPFNPGDMRPLSGRRLAAIGIAALITALPLAAAAPPPVPKDVTTLLTEYRKEYTQVKEPNDKVLRTEAGKIAAGLVKEGRADDARRVAEQMENKIAGNQVLPTHPALTELLTKYDAAVTKAAQPIRERYGRRVDALVQNYAGKDMAAVLALGDVKKQIEGKAPLLTPGSDKSASSVTQPATTATLALSGQVWKGPYGQYSFKADGEGIKKGGSDEVRFIWKALEANKLEYVEVNKNGGYMNRRIWTFDSSQQTATITDPSNTYPPATHTRQGS